MIEIERAQITGTPKQVSWAETIRGNFMSSALGLVLHSDSEAKRTNADPEKYAIGRADLIARIERVAAKSDARWWIDTARFQDFRTLLRSI